MIGYGLLFFVLLLVIAYGVWVWSWFRTPALIVPVTSTDADRRDAADCWLTALHAKKRFNGAILILKDGKPLLMKTYGFTDHTKQQPLTNQSSFRLASVSKQFTAAGVLLLIERGVLESDAPVGDYLEGFPYNGVTTRHLLNQTSGVPDNYLSLAEEHHDEAGDVLSVEKAVELITRYPGVATLPGNAYA